MAEYGWDYRCGKCRRLVPVCACKVDAPDGKRITDPDAPYDVRPAYDWDQRSRDRAAIASCRMCDHQGFIELPTPVDDDGRPLATTGSSVRVCDHGRPRTLDAARRSDLT